MASAVTSDGGSTARRLPRWTRREILVLVEAKRAAERSGSPAAESKWAAVSAHCRRSGVDRGPVQCRKRWGNLACDFRKVRAWEGDGNGGSPSSFWRMRSDERRENRLPGFFDREVYELLEVGLEVKEEEEEVFDSGRRRDGLFEEEEEEEGPVEVPVAVMPISERRFETFHCQGSDPGTSNDNQQTDEPEKGSSSWEGQKRQRTSEQAEDMSLESQLIEILERNSRALLAQLETQSINCQLDRDQRKNQAEGLLGALTKLADSLGRVADRL